MRDAWPEPIDKMFRRGFCGRQPMIVTNTLGETEETDNHYHQQCFQDPIRCRRCAWSFFDFHENLKDKYGWEQFVGPTEEDRLDR